MVVRADISSLQSAYLMTCWEAKDLLTSSGVGKKSRRGLFFDKR